MKLLLSTVLMLGLAGGGGYYYLQTGGEVPTELKPYANQLTGTQVREDVSQRSAEYQLCHRSHAKLLSDDPDHPSRKACQCLETRIAFVSPSVKKSVLARLETDYEQATGKLLGGGRIGTMQAAYDFLDACGIASPPVMADAPATPHPVDTGAIEALLPTLE